MGSEITNGARDYESEYQGVMLKLPSSSETGSDITNGAREYASEYQGVMLNPCIL